MYCGECGAKNEKDSLFCSECGAKLEHEEPVKKGKKTTAKKEENKSESTKKEPAIENTPRERKKLSKKYKILIGAGALFIILLIVVWQVLANITSPKHVVSEYMNAISSKDYDALYSYISLDGDTTFVSEEQYKSLLEDSLSDVNIANYNIGAIRYEDGGLTAVVTVNVSINSGGISDTNEVEFELTKQKGKKYLLFDNWVLDSNMLSSGDIVEDYEIIVPTGTEVTYNGILLTDKYLDQDSDEESTVDTYVLPQVFATETSVTFKLANGMEFTQEISPSTYYTSYRLAIDEDDITEEEKEKISETTKTSMETLMNSLVNKSSFDDIKDQFATDQDLDDLKEVYEDALESLNRRDYTISNFKIDKVTISSLSFDRDYQLMVSFRADYSFDATSNEGETKTEEDYNYYRYYFVYDDGYKLVDANGLPSTWVYFW